MSVRKAFALQATVLFLLGSLAAVPTAAADGYLAADEDLATMLGRGNDGLAGGKDPYGQFEGDLGPRTDLALEALHPLGDLDAVQSGDLLRHEILASLPEGVTPEELPNVLTKGTRVDDDKGLPGDEGPVDHECRTNPPRPPADPAPAEDGPIGVGPIDLDEEPEVHVTATPPELPGKQPADPVKCGPAHTPRQPDGEPEQPHVVAPVRVDLGTVDRIFGLERRSDVKAALRIQRAVDSVVLTVHPPPGVASTVTAAPVELGLAPDQEIRYRIGLTPNLLGDHDIRFVATGIANGTPFSDTAYIRLHIDADPSKHRFSTYEMGQVPPVPLPSATIKAPVVPGDDGTLSREMVESLGAPPTSALPSTTPSGFPHPHYGDLSSYTKQRKDDTILFIHGLDPTMDTDAGTDVGGDFTKYKTVFEDWGWTDVVFKDLMYYRCDIGGDVDLSDYGILYMPDPHDAHLDYGDDPNETGWGSDDNTEPGHREADECSDIGWTSTTYWGAPKGHTADTSIEHIGYHMAWMLYNEYNLAGDCPKVVAHSMGGLVTRYAIAQVAKQHPEFPQHLCVEDVITLGTPHDGKGGWANFCDWKDQCDQMQGDETVFSWSDSSFMDWLETHGVNPQGVGGTGWTVMGSEGDGNVNEEGATESIKADHRVRYWQDIDHGSNEPDAWRGSTKSIITAKLSLYENSNPSVGYEYLVDPSEDGGPWPARFSDLSLAYELWGCGEEGVNTAWPFAAGLIIAGEPYTPGFDCWYRVNVGSGYEAAHFEVVSPSGVDRDLYVRKGSPTGPLGCSETATTTGQTACSISNPAAATYYVKVETLAASKQPFHLKAYALQEGDDCGTGADAGNVATSATPIPANGLECLGALPLHDTVDWYQINAILGQSIFAQARPNVLADYELCLFKPSSPAVPVDCSTSDVGYTDAVMHQAGETGAWWLRVERYSGTGSYRLLASVAAAHNDCQGSGDAPDTMTPGSAVFPQVTNCTGRMPQGDAKDVYQVSANTGAGITVTMQPNPGADLDLCLYRPSDLVNPVHCSHSSRGMAEKTLWTAGEPGAWRFVVWSVHGKGTYTMVIDVQTISTLENDCGTGTDAPGTQASAAWITPNVACAGQLGGADKSDWYAFTVASGKGIDATMTPEPGANFQMCIYAPGFYAPHECGKAGAGTTENIVVPDATGGTWTLEVRHQAGSGDYDLVVKLLGTGAAENDCGLGYDAGDTVGAASPLNPPPPPCTGRLPSGDVRDFYELTVGGGYAIDLTMTPNLGADFELCLYKEELDYNLIMDCSEEGKGEMETIYFDDVDPGTYYVMVYQYAGSGLYKLTVSVTPPPPPNDCGTGVDAGDDQDSATLILPPKTKCVGKLPWGDTHDWYRFKADVGQTIDVSVIPNPGGKFPICLHEPDDSLISCDLEPTGEAVAEEHVAEVWGYYTLLVKKQGGAGTYQLTVKVSDAPKDDCYTGVDAGASHSAATKTVVPAYGCPAFFHTASGTDYEDWYKFDVPAGKQAKVWMTPNPGSNFNIYLYKQTDSTNYVAVGASQPAGGQEYAAATFAAAGEHRLRVVVASGSGSYTLTIVVDDPPNDCSMGIEAGNTHAGATFVPLSAYCVGTLGYGDTQDWYRFSVSVGQTITVSLLPNGGVNQDLLLYKATDATTPVEQSAVAGPGQTESMQHVAGESGQYRVLVKTAPSYGKYALTIKIAPRNDCYTGQDGAASHAAALTMPKPTISCPAFLPVNDAVDWFKFGVTAGQTIDLSMSPNLGADFHLYLYGPSDTVNPVDKSENAGLYAQESVYHPATQTGDYRVKVVPIAGTGPYSMTLTVLSPNDCYTNQDGAATHAAATPLGVDVYDCPGKMPSGDLADWFRFPVADGQTIKATLKPTSGANMDLAIHSPTDATNALDSSAVGGMGGTESVHWMASGAGEYRLRLSKASGSGDYTLTVVIASPNDCGTGWDAAGTHASASQLQLPKLWCHAELPKGDTVDWYRFDVLAGQTIAVSAMPNYGVDVSIWLYSQSDSTNHLATGLQYGSGGTESFSFPAGSSGAYRLRVQAPTGAGSYWLKAELVSPNDCGTGWDAGGSFAAASFLQVPAYSCKASKPASDAEDWYRFPVNSGQVIDATLMPNGGANFDFWLYAPSGTYLTGGGNAGTGGTETLQIEAQETGEYRLRITAAGGAGDYWLIVTKTSPNDCGTGGDAGDTHGTASAVVLPKSWCSAALPKGDSTDWYRFNVDAGDLIDVMMSPNAGANYNIWIYGPADANDPFDYSESGGYGATESVLTPAYATGEYRVRVVIMGGSGSYSLNLKIQAENDCYTNADGSNTYAGALPVSLAVSCTGNMPKGDSYDHFAVYLNAGETLQASMTPNPGANYNLYLMLPTDSTYSYAYSQEGGSATDAYTYTAGQTGWFRVVVYKVTGSGSYSLAMSLTTHNDCNTGGDAGWSHPTATLIPSSVNCGGLMEFKEYDDWYRFTVSAGQTVSVWMTPNPGANFDVSIYKGSDSSTPVAPSPGYGKGTTEHVKAVASESSQYRVRVADVTGSGTYSLVISVTSAPQGDCGTTTDASGSSGSPMALSTTSTCTGYLGGSDTSDWFQFHVTSGQSIEVKMKPNSGADYDLYLYAPSGAEKGKGENGGSTQEYLPHTATETGYYKVHVKWYSGSGSYTLTATVTAAASPPASSDCGVSGDAYNGWSGATTLSLPVPPCKSSLSASAGDYGDSWRVCLSSGTTLTASATMDAGLDINIFLYPASSSSYIAQSAKSGAGVSEGFSKPITTTACYEFHASWASGAGNYWISLSTATSGSSGSGDCNGSTDASNSIWSATLLTGSTPCTGTLDASDTSDAFRVFLSQGDILSVSLAMPSGANFELQFYQESTMTSESTTWLSGAYKPAGVTETFKVGIVQSGYYVLRFSAASGSGTWTLSTIKHTEADDCGTNADVAMASASAKVLVAEHACIGTLTGSTDKDTYKLTDPGGSGQGRIDIAVATGTITICYDYTSGGTFPNGCYDYTGGKNYVIFMNYGSSGGSDYIRVSKATSGNVRYSISLNK